MRQGTGSESLTGGVSVWDNKKVLEMDDCMMLGMYIMLLNYTLENGKNYKLYVYLVTILKT